MRTGSSRPRGRRTRMVRAREQAVDRAQKRGRRRARTQRDREARLQTRATGVCDEEDAGRAGGAEKSRGRQAAEQARPAHLPQAAGTQAGEEREKRGGAPSVPVKKKTGAKRRATERRGGHQGEAWAGGRGWERGGAKKLRHKERTPKKKRDRPRPKESGGQKRRAPRGPATRRGEEEGTRWKAPGATRRKTVAKSGD